MIGVISQELTDLTINYRAAADGARNGDSAVDALRLGRFDICKTYDRKVSGTLSAL